MSVKKGDKIKVEYTGTLEDGSVFDSTEKHGAPLEFEVGSGQLIKGFDDAVSGMAVDEEKTINLEPAQAYGDPNPEMVKDIPRDKLPKEDLKPGMMLMMAMPNGAQFPAVIKEINDTTAKLDLNHPLAGKKLTFKIKVIGIN